MEPRLGFSGWLSLANGGDPLAGGVEYNQRVAGVPSFPPWYTMQIDVCAITGSSPTRRCGVATTEINGLPQWELAQGRLIIEFHDPLEPTDCHMEWTAMWRRSER